MGVVDVCKGLTFCTLWYCSILFGFMMLYCPLLPLLFISNHAFRTCTDKIFSFWEYYPTALLQLFFGTKIFVHGDYLDPEDTALVVMNHRTRVDWNYLWLCMFHATKRAPREPWPEGDRDRNHVGTYDALQNGGLSYQNGGYNVNKIVCNGKTKSKGADKKKNSGDWSVFSEFSQKMKMKYVLKDEIRHIPGPGWVMQLNCFIYIKRNWESDEAEIKEVTEYLEEMDYKYQLLIFPEGTDLTESTMKKSDSFAKKNNMPLYRQVLHPRVRGFSHLTRAMGRSLTAVYDITIAYGGCDGCQLRDLIVGNFPPEVHFCIKRYAASSLPKDELSLGNWLNERWRCKEEQLKDFYKHGRFVDASNRLEHLERGMLISALFFWTLLVLSCPVLLVLFAPVRLAVLLWCLFFVLLSLFSRGFHHFEMGCFNLKKPLRTLFRRSDKIK